ncbi:hypothetical protein LJR225_000716 [Phenylobacterium sp. LjRoot225]|uniref:hypothetical protein n=1 Tax=Phenylobacterium sp. LjRoot225 TaxID=3342285 RepID=UPI003ECED09D
MSRKPPLWECRTAAERAAMVAWVNDQLDLKTSEELMARRYGPEADAAFYSYWIKTAIDDHDASRLTELTADPEVRRAAFERLFRGPGRPAGETPIQRLARFANTEVTQVLALWREHYGRERGVLDPAMDIVIARFAKLDPKLTKEQLEKYRHDHGAEVPD